MKSLMRQDSGIHHLHFTESDIPLQAFSDFTKVSRSPIIRSIRLLAAHATVVSRHRTLPTEHTVRSAPSFTSTPRTQIRSERNYVTSKTETETRFWPYPKPKNRFYRTNPVLETLLSQSPMNWGDQWNYNSQVASNLFWQHVTRPLTYWPPKLIVTSPYLMNHLWQFAAKSVRFHNIISTRLVMNERKDGFRTLCYASSQSILAEA